MSGNVTWHGPESHSSVGNHPEVQRDGTKADHGYKSYLTPPCSLTVLDVFTGIGRKGCKLSHKKELTFIARCLGLTQRFLMKKIILT